MRNNLITVRKISKLTQAQMAKELGITERHYQALEAGTSDGSVGIWQILAKKLNTTIDFLLEQDS